MAGSKTAVGAMLLAVLLVSRADAQSLPVGDVWEDYLRVLQLSGRAEAGSFTVRPLSATRIELPVGAHPWSEWLEAANAGLTPEEGLTVTALRLRAFANSKFPTGHSDGAIWQGRGVTTVLDGGGVARFGPMTVALRPALLFTQNASFELAPVFDNGISEYAYPWRVIDLPQRFGPESFWTLDPGQSEVSLDVLGARVGFGTTNLWWGPGIRNAIVMSSNAPGFPHAYIGTDGRMPTRVGGFEARWIWGRLQQSKWFEADESSSRFITGIAGAYSPSFLDGLSLGFARVFYVLVPASGVPLGDYFAVFRGVRKRTLVSDTNPTGDDEHDQIISLFARWLLRESGFEVYGEWARNDHAWELRDLLLEPEHSQAYTLGLRKVFELSAQSMVTVTAELSHLEADPTFQVRDKGTYYVHNVITQGYTQKGQVIGAGIGPGGNAQHLGLDLYGESGRIGLYLERQVHDNDAYYGWAEANDQSYCCHDVSLHLGGHALRFVGDFDVGAGFVVTREYNRYFFGNDVWNLNLSLSARWRAQYRAF